MTSTRSPAAASGDAAASPPEAGPLNRATFRDMIYGRVDTRLALLPRPNHARVIDPHTLAAE